VDEGLGVAVEAGAEVWVNSAVTPGIGLRAAGGTPQAASTQASQMTLTPMEFVGALIIDMFSRCGLPGNEPRNPVDYNDSMPIRLLTAEVASQIAAGEVIERPASVVKELMENALDAGAGKVSVAVVEAGRRMIEVADDGGGIDSGELALAVSRHATSKLSKAEDLFHISTLGFRGEALASIGSVSRMTIITRVARSNQGARLRVDAGRAEPVEAIGAPVGTVVRVEDLFYNVPARLKFLKTDVTERRAIDALLARYALAYPRVGFSFSADGSLALQSAGDGDRRAILAGLYGVEVGRQLLEVEAEEPGIRLSGYISPISLTRSNRKDITVFVNGRWVQDTPLTTAVVQAYHTLLMVGRYPMAALFIQMEPADVDVNVHPAKAEVRFKNPDRVFSSVQRAVRRSLLAYAPVPQVAPQLWGSQGSQGPQSTQADPGWALAHPGPVAMNSQTPASDQARAGADHLPLLRLVGQIGATYVAAEGPDGLYLIDQHAAHERVLFEKLMAQHDMKKIPSQSLLTPAAVTFPPQAAALLNSQMDILKHFGFEVEEFGPNTFQVRAVPALFAGSDPAAALRALVEDFEEDETPLQNEVERKIAARVCKRMAVKGGQPLSPEEQRTLLDSLEACDSPRTCPHGRPTMIHLSVDMLERQFGRRGAR
jgi:DNA mismatch repair protein MutL